MIREVRASDLPALAELAKSSFADAFGWSTSPERLKAELEANRSEAYFTRALEQDTILVYEDDRGLAGYVQFGEPKWPDLATAPGDAAIHRLYVATDRQSQGIGRRLLQSKQFWLQVWEHNPRAIKFYQSFGFELRRKTQYLAGTKGDELIMVKTIKD